MPKVILVDENDNEIGIEDKLEAHEDGGKLHRAFSIFVFNDEGKLLIQRRADHKYHCPGKWANTCCSHPKPDEDVLKAAHRRIKEEMGFDCSMKELFSFQYKAEFDNGLTEKEIDHAILGKYNGNPDPNPDEVGDWKWIDPDELILDMDKNPEKYTKWFKISIEDVLKKT